METMVILNDYVVNFDACVAMMDDDLREEIHNEIAPCTDQEFLDEYVKRHETKFGEPFQI